MESSLRLNRRTRRSLLTTLKASLLSRRTRPPCSLMGADPVALQRPALERACVERSCQGKQQLVKAKDGRRFEILATVRETIYGFLYHAAEVLPGGQYGDHFAIKEFSLKLVETMFPRGAPRRGCEDPRAEVAAMQHLKAVTHGEGHANVLSIDEALHDDGYMYVILPYCDGGELFDLLLGERLQLNQNRLVPMREAQVRPLFRQLLQGIKYLHSHDICHRDISLENTMLTDDCSRLLIIDFGLSLRCPRQSDGSRALVTCQARAGKLDYMPPEVFYGAPFDGFAADIWSAGILLYLLLTGGSPPCHPVAAAKWPDRKYASIARLAQRDLAFSEHAIDLLTCMLQSEPSHRPSAAKLLDHHPWFAVGLPEEPFGGEETVG